MRQQTKPRMLLLRGCRRCHGDLILDSDEYRKDDEPDEYVCLQCGRRTTLEALAAKAEEERELVDTAAG